MRVDCTEGLLLLLFAAEVSKAEMDVHSDLPITGMCVVSDPNKAPPNYTVVRISVIINM